MGVQKQFGKESVTDSPVNQGDSHKSKKPTNELLDPSIVMPKKKAGGKPPMSPIRQVMKAVTEAAINPKKKKAPKVANGPSSQNHKGPNRKDSADKSTNVDDGDQD